MAVLREPAQYAQWVTFYESVVEGKRVDVGGRRIFPRMTYVGSEGDPTAGHEVPISIASTIRARRSELESMGWCVKEIPGRDHSVCLDPATVVPVVREFLDAVP